MSTQVSTYDSPIVLFDGVCKFCNACVNFVINHDKKQRFKFCPIQTDIGLELMAQYGLRDSGLTSMILIENNRAFRKSSAALRIAKHLSPPWSLLYILLIVPAPIRNAVYDFIGNRRYQWFGKFERCIIPDEHLKSRFLD